MKGKRKVKIVISITKRNWLFLIFIMMNVLKRSYYCFYHHNGKL